MPIIRKAIGAALGADQVKNGFNGPKIPFTQKRPAASPDLSSNKSRQGADYDDGFPRRPADPPGYMPMNNDMLVPPHQPQSSSAEYYSDYNTYPDQQIYRDNNVLHTEISTSPNFRPLALPQLACGQYEPFLRGYSDELRQYGIYRDDFIQILDTINVAIIPNPENQIFQKGANIAGYFVPGAASIALIGGQFGVGIGAAFGHASAVSKALCEANLQVFLRAGLEICVGKTKDVDQEVGFSSSNYDSHQAFDTSPQDRLAMYGNRVAPITETFAPVKHAGRNDPIAMLGRGIGNRDDARKAKRAQKHMNKGKSKHSDRLDESLQWLMVRRASPDALAYWQKALQEADAALQSSQNEGRQ